MNLTSQNGRFLNLFLAGKDTRQRLRKIQIAFHE